MSTAADARTPRDIITTPIGTASPETPFGVALGPAAGGTMALLSGLAVFFLFSQKANPSEEVGIRLFGAFFMLFGLMFINFGLGKLGGILAARRRKHAREAWLRDYDWHREAPAHDARILPQLLLVAAYSAIVAPFNFLWTVPSTFFWVVVGLLDLLGLAFLVELLHRFQKWLRFGRARVTWHTFPALVGGRLEGYLQIRRSVREAPAQMTLSAIVERGTERGGKAENATELWTHEIEVRGREGRYDFSYALPPDGPATLLSSLLPNYWKLSIRIPTPGPDFKCSFLAPVYGSLLSAPSSAPAVVEVAPRAAALPPQARRVPRLAALIFGALGLLFGTFGVTQAAESWRIWSSPARTEGTVLRQQTSISRDSRSNRSTTMYAAVIGYEVGGRSYETVQQVASGSPSHAEGERVTVVYDPANPGSGYLLSVLDLFLLPGMLLIFSLACVGAATISAMIGR